MSVDILFKPSNFVDVQVRKWWETIVKSFITYNVDNCGIDSDSQQVDETLIDLFQHLTSVKYEKRNYAGISSISVLKKVNNSWEGILKKSVETIKFKRIKWI